MNTYILLQNTVGIILRTRRIAAPKILILLAQYFNFFAQCLILLFEFGCQDSRDTSFAADTSIVPIFATIQVPTISTKFFFTNVACSHVVFLSIKTFHTVPFLTTISITSEGWFTIITTFFITECALIHALFTHMSFTTLTFYQFPTFCALDILTRGTRSIRTNTGRAIFSMAMEATCDGRVTSVAVVTIVLHTLIAGILL